MAESNALGKLDPTRVSKLLGQTAYNQEGHDLHALSLQLPLLLVFLRQLGCAFCHCALLDIRMQEPEIQLEGAEIVLVHMASDKEAEEVFDLYELNHALKISDPQQKLYQAFGLQRGRLQDIYNPQIWLDTSMTESLSDDEIDPKLGDPLQMPGVFLYYEGKIRRAFYYDTIAARPRYSELAVFPLAGVKASNR